MGVGASARPGRASRPSPWRAGRASASARPTSRPPAPSPASASARPAAPAPSPAWGRAASRRRRRASPASPETPERDRPWPACPTCPRPRTACGGRTGRAPGPRCTGAPARRPWPNGAGRTGAGDGGGGGLRLHGGRLPCRGRRTASTRADPRPGAGAATGFRACVFRRPNAPLYINHPPDPNRGGEKSDFSQNSSDFMSSNCPEFRFRKSSLLPTLPHPDTSMRRPGVPRTEVRPHVRVHAPDRRSHTAPPSATALLQRFLSGLKAGPVSPQAPAGPGGRPIRRGAPSGPAAGPRRGRGGRADRPRRVVRGGRRPSRGRLMAKRFRRDAANQGAVLDAFEAQGWPVLHRRPPGAPRRAGRQGATPRDGSLPQPPPGGGHDSVPLGRIGGRRSLGGGRMTGRG